LEGIKRSGEDVAYGSPPIRIGAWPFFIRGFARSFSYPKETWIAIGSGLGIGLYLLCRYVLGVDAQYSGWALISVLILGGAPLVFDLIRKTLAGEFGSDLLAGLSIATSVFVGEYLAGCIVVLMLSGGTALEQYATRRASAAWVP
jgi:cation transport ATPase